MLYILTLLEKEFDEYHIISTSTFINSASIESVSFKMQLRFYTRYVILTILS